MSTTLFEAGLKMMAAHLPKAAGGRIVYGRGNDKVWIDAAFGHSEFETTLADSTIVESSDRDFIVSVDDLILGGELATPQRGDRITVVEENYGDGQVYEVLAPGGAQVYRLCDPQGHLIRIHTKRLT